MNIKMPHEGHDRHLCFLHNVGFVRAQLEDYKELVRNPQFVCRTCGRTAADEKNLCDPEKL